MYPDWVKPVGTRLQVRVLPRSLEAPQRHLVNRAMEISTWYGLTLHLGALFFTAMMLVLAYRVFSGMGVTWRGGHTPESLICEVIAVHIFQGFAGISTICQAMWSNGVSLDRSSVSAPAKMNSGLPNPSREKELQA